MCNETGNAVTSGTSDEMKIRYAIVQSDNDISPVKRRNWWNLINAGEFRGP